MVRCIIIIYTILLNYYNIVLLCDIVIGEHRGTSGTGPPLTITMSQPINAATMAVRSYRVQSAD